MKRKLIDPPPPRIFFAVVGVIIYVGCIKICNLVVRVKTISQAERRLSVTHNDTRL